MDMTRILIKEDRFNSDNDVYAQVDQEDFMRVNSFEWRLVTDKHGHRYACRNVTTEEGKKKRIWMHRYIVDLPDTMEETREIYGHNIYAEHLDKDGINNHKSNIVLSTASEMSINKKSQKVYPGVIKRGNGYEASVTHQNKTMYLGIYDTSIKAAIVRDRKALSLFPRVFISHLSELHIRVFAPYQKFRAFELPRPYVFKNNCVACEFEWQQLFLDGHDHPDIVCSHK